MNRNTQVSNIASLALGAVLIFAGFLFLVGQFVGARFWDISWPFVILIPGLLLFVGMVAGGKSAGGLAIPASIVTTLGLLMLFQNTFNYFESWAYAWALIPTAVGVGMMINGMWSDQPELIDKGQKTARVGAVMFAIGFVFFEFVIRIGRLGGGFLGGFIGPVVLIVIGGYLLFRNLLAVGNQPSSRLPATPSAPATQPMHPATTTNVPTISKSSPEQGSEPGMADKANMNEFIYPETPQKPPSAVTRPGSIQLTEPLINGQEKEKITVV